MKKLLVALALVVAGCGGGAHTNPPPPPPGDPLDMSVVVTHVNDLSPVPPTVDADLPVVDADVPKSCHGTTTDCALEPDRISCDHIAGCLFFDGTCSGVATDCSLLTSSQCITQSGCTPGASSCTGFPDLCSSQIDEFLCKQQDGCSWTPGTCSGTPEPCSSQPSESLCNLQPGCVWS
jgi:hypothetical protein